MDNSYERVVYFIGDALLFASYFFVGYLGMKRFQELKQMQNSHKRLLELTDKILEEPLLPI
ncbi:MAG: hypothetical protein ABH840_01545 [Nanoarchaeota archaeon]